MDVLEKINQDKRQHIAHQKQIRSQDWIMSAVKDMLPCRAFETALRQTHDMGNLALIAEIKKASPSKGLIRANFDVASIAISYQQAGASCLSVLTDIPYFQGDDSYLAKVKSVVGLPVLRKDFMIDPYQIYESRWLGADCILLIMACLDNVLAQELESIAHDLGMGVLIEVHDGDEMERALTHLKSALIGINNRNLKTLAVDLSTSQSLLPQLDSDRFGIAESGLYHHDDLIHLRNHGAKAFLIGESLMRQDDILLATRAILGQN